MRASPRPALLILAALVAACGGSAPSPAGTTQAPSATVVNPSPSIAVPTAPPPTSAPSPTTTPVAIVSPAPTTTVAPTRTATAAATAPPPTPKPTAKPTPEPTPKPTPKPTAKPTPEPTPKPTPRPVTVGLEAVDFAFAPSALSVPAATPFKIVFSNQDSGIPHNVVIRTGAGSQVFSGALVTGAADVTYAVPALSAGSYALACIVHPAMTGSLTVN